MCGADGKNKDFRVSKNVGNSSWEVGNTWTNAAVVIGVCFVRGSRRRRRKWRNEQ